MFSSALSLSVPSSRFDVTVRGAGVVGRTLALLLARERLRVALVGGPPQVDAGPDVRAYALNAASRALLESVRAWPQGGDGLPDVTPVQEMQIWGDEGAMVHFSAAQSACEALAWVVNVPALEQRLAQAVSFQSGIECFADEAPQAALTVVCEGKRSRTRQALGLEFDARPYSHKALVACVRCQMPHGGVARQWFADAQVMALLPLDGAQGCRVALVWSLPAHEADAWLGAPMHDVASAVQTRCGAILGTMALDSAPQAWALERSRALHWTARVPAAGGQGAGSVALAGDAAHAMHPLAGQGLNLGLADVAELAQVIGARESWRGLDDPKLLRRYERARQADVAAMSGLTDALFGLFSHTGGYVQTLRGWGMKAFDRSPVLKRWVARQASGLVG